MVFVIRGDGVLFGGIVCIFLILCLVLFRSLVREDFVVLWIGLRVVVNDVFSLLVWVFMFLERDDIILVILYVR